uniref:hypothetical protein n=3 Tax=Pantoea TaxID=53335 RepID=UPI002B1D5E0C
SKPKVPRERREDGPAAAEVRWPALRLARPEKKLPRLTVTAFTNLILTDQYYAMGGLFLPIRWPGMADAVKIIIRLIIQACLWPVSGLSCWPHILTISQLWNQSDTALTNLLTIPLRYRFQNVNRASLTFIQPERRSLCAEDVRHAVFNYLSG